MSWAPLSRSSQFALYRQIAEQLRQAIEAGATRLPTERSLARAFGVARVTVRLALDILADEQLVSRQRRFGTLVTADPSSAAHASDAQPKSRELVLGIDPH